MLAGLLSFTAINPVNTDPFISQVKLLMPFQGANGSTGSPGMDDVSPAAHGTATVAGNGQISTSKFIFQSSSYLGDGSGDGVSFADSADWWLNDGTATKQYTIEAWINPAITSLSGKAIICQGGTIGENCFMFWCNGGNGELSFWSTTSVGSISAVAVSSGISWTSGQWYFVAADNDATGLVRVYRGLPNGTATMLGSGSGFAMPDSPGRLNVGTDNSGTRSWNGNIQYPRITKGKARYATDGTFPVPTAPFPTS